ncbi:hypothetical protein [Streptomyces aureoversilis]|uniref:Uncharacterized protein n=1 Tax=Streptomyces aureoversilis TaxID=67277 RepID=A0ABV9ZVY6_9ACTN
MFQLEPVRKRSSSGTANGICSSTPTWQFGVACGLAVRKHLRPDQTVDFIIFADAAVLIEEEQGDADYHRGRNSVYFKDSARWAQRFESAWGHGADSAPMALQAYDLFTRPLLDGSNWDTGRVTQAVDGLQKPGTGITKKSPASNISRRALPRPSPPTKLLWSNTWLAARGETLDDIADNDERGFLRRWHLEKQAVEEQLDGIARASSCGGADA